MENLALLVVCFLGGMGLRRTGRLPEETAAVLNAFIIHLSLPALVLLHIHRLTPEAGLLYSALMPWLLFAGGLLFFWWMGRIFHLSRETVGALMLLGGLGNTSFVGLPLIEAWYGPEGLGAGIIADQLGSFLALSTVGIAVAAAASADGGFSLRDTGRRILRFPPFIALVTALVLRPVPFPPLVESVLGQLGATLTPLALASVGFQLRFGQVQRMGIPLLLGLSYKLLLGPLLILLLYLPLPGLETPLLRVTLFEAAMGPMITAGIIAANHNLNPPLVTLMLGIGIPLSLLTSTLWYLLLELL